MKKKIVVVTSANDTTGSIIIDLLKKHKPIARVRNQVFEIIAAEVPIEKAVRSA